MRYQISHQIFPIRKPLLVAAIASVGLLGGWISQPVRPPFYMAEMAAAKSAVCEIMPIKDSKVKGNVTFTAMGDHVHVVGDITGLAPNSKHGFHIHEGSEVGDDGAKAGGHYNPEKKDHGLPEAPAHHGGDMGNIEADKDGKAHIDVMVMGVSIDGATNGVIGHTIIVHADPDDGKTQPSGNSGARVAGGVIKPK